MTDEEKLELITQREEDAWLGLREVASGEEVGDHFPISMILEITEVIERCQRIRAGLAQPIYDGFTREEHLQVNMKPGATCILPHCPDHITLNNSKVG